MKNYNLYQLQSLLIPFIGGRKKLDFPLYYELSVNNLQFKSLESFNDEGGSIKILTPLIKYNINNTIFSNNFANLSGAAFHFDIPYSLNIDNYTLKNHTSENSVGTVYAVSSQEHISVNNTSIVDSLANNKGGLLYLHGNNISIQNSRFINSKGLYGGNTYFNSAKYLNLKNISTSNTTGSNGGNYYKNNFTKYFN